MNHNINADGIDKMLAQMFSTQPRVVAIPQEVVLKAMQSAIEELELHEAQASQSRVSEIQRLATQVGDLKRRNEHLQRECENLAAAFSSAESQYNESQQDLEIAESHVEHLKIENDHLKAENERLTAFVASLEPTPQDSATAALQAEIERLTAHVKDLMDSGAKVETQLSLANNEIEVLKAENLELNDDVEHFKDINSNLRVTHDNLNERLEVQRNTISGCKSEVERLRKQRDDARMTLSSIITSAENHLKS